MFSQIKTKNKEKNNDPASATSLTSIDTPVNSEDFNDNITENIHCHETTSPLSVTSTIDPFASDNSEDDPEYIYSGSDESNSGVLEREMNKKRSKNKKEQQIRKNQQDIYEKINMPTAYTEESETITSPYENATCNARKKLFTTTVEIGEQPKKNKKRVPKPHTCNYCGVPQTKLNRHLVRKHGNEELVKVALEKQGSKDQVNIFEKIRKLGDFKAFKTDKLLTAVRNSPNGVKNETYLPCQFCKGMVSKTNLRTHVRSTCKFKYNAKSARGISKVLMFDVNPAAKDLYSTYILPRLGSEHFFTLAATDNTIIMYGNAMAKKYLHIHKHHDKMITQNVRYLCKIFTMMKENNKELKEVKEIFNVAHYDNFVKVAQCLAGHNEEQGGYLHPSVITSLCGLMRHVGTLLRCELLRLNDLTGYSNLKRYLYLLMNSQTIDMTKKALETRTQAQRNKVERLPTLNEINSLLRSIENQANKSFESILNEFSSELWCTLTKLCLIFLMVFNRKRPGDIEKASVQEFENLSRINSDYASKLDVSSRVKANNLGRFLARGKLNRSTSIIVTKPIIKILTFLIKHRNDAQVPESNKYLFANPKMKRYDYFKADKVLEAYCNENGYVYDDFRANKLRKHLASCTSTFDKDCQKVISSFMGHSIDIHENIYQQALVQTDIVTVGNILLQASGYEDSDQIAPVSEAIENVNDWVNHEVDAQSHTENTLTKNIDQPQSHIENTQAMNIDQPKLTTIFEQDEIISDSESIELRNLKPFDAQSTANSDAGSRNSAMSTPVPRRLPLVSKNRRTWTTPERSKMRRCFSECLENLEVPTINECQQILCNSADDWSGRSATQMQSWVRAEIKRKSEPRSRSRKSNWTTPRKNKCRDYFRKYYEGKGKTKYPSQRELIDACRTIPEFKGFNPALIRSHIQHDVKYVSERN